MRPPPSAILCPSLRPLLRSRPLSLSIRHSSSTSAPLTGLHALITGASRGIGFAIARSLAEQGCSLTLVARSPSPLTSALTALPNNHLHNAIPEDVSRREFWAGLTLPELSRSRDGRAGQAGSAGGSGGEEGRKGKSKEMRVDILVNAAGLSHQSLFLRTTEDLIEEVVRTNLMGTMWACKSIGRRMMRQKSLDGADVVVDDKVRKAIGKGAIVNVASLLATHGGLGSAAYVASKAGIVGFTRALAAELGPSGIRINTVLPGYIETDMTDAMSSEARDQALARIPVKRFGTADEVADAVLFLIKNAYAQNCVLNLDGGLSAVVRRVMYMK